MDYRRIKKVDVLARARGKNPKVVKPKKARSGERGETKISENPEAIGRIFSIIYKLNEIDFTNYKLTTVSRRINRRAHLHKCDSLAQLASLMEKSPELTKQVCEDIFIHVTAFFREPESFKALKKNIFPKLLKSKMQGVPLRIWVPGCSTGEEAYSLAMALLEIKPALDGENQFQIFATDISELAVEKARHGVYKEGELKGVSAERLKRFFEPTKGGYRVTREIRESCIFSRHDITRNPPFAKIDLISCRNVLIYFDPELQKQVLPIFHYALRPSGYLWLGRSEAPTGIAKYFSLTDKTHKIYSKINTALPASFRFPRRAITGRIDDVKNIENHLSALDHHKEMDRIAAAKYAPATVVINSDMEIVQVRGNTSQFLALPTGQPSYNILKMVRPELLPTMRMILQSVQRENAAVRKDGITYGSDQIGQKQLSLEAIPINPQAPMKERRFLVFFEEPHFTHRKPPKKIAAQPKPVSSDKKDAYIADLFQELDSMREYYQALAEGYEATQEELSASNEELQSAIEEFQTTNEELETAKEELQAANEELSTVNDELQKRNDELGQAMSKLAKSEERFRLMVEGVKDYAIFMLDTEGYITSWNQGAQRLKGYTADEIIGEHFSKFYPPEEVKIKPKAELLEAARAGRVEDESWRVRKDGTLFWANVVITRIDDEQGRHVGFAKITRDLTERKRVEEELRQAKATLEDRVEARTRELQSSLNVRDEFLSIASHELKTPLTSLKLQLQLADRAKNKMEPIHIADVLEMCLKQSNSLIELVDTLLDVSRVQSGKFTLDRTDVDLCELIKDVLGRFAEQLVSAQINVHMNLHGPVVGFWDRRRLEQVISNLISNAIKYAPRGSLNISAEVEGERAILGFKDSGPGIPKNMQPRVFERFERGHNSRKIGGLGLGLFIVKRIIEAHAGAIRVESKVGDGTIFRIELPVSAPSATTEAG